MNTDPTNPNDKAREVEQWLESALRQYGQGEPRPGLENRVLASLRIEQDRVERNHRAAPRRWWWTMATATALAVIAVWVWQSGREMRPKNVAAIPSTAHERAQAGSIEAATGSLPGKTAAPKLAHAANRPTQAATRASARPPVHDLAQAAAPKLDQFPSPQPLSEQEKILMSYVENYPETAALVAQARAEALQRDLKEEASEADKGNME